MSTLSDQSFAKNTWVTVTGLTNGISYILQNRGEQEVLYVFEASSLPTGLAGEGRIVKVLGNYEFVKGTDGIHVFSPKRDGLISVHVNTFDTTGTMADQDADNVNITGGTIGGSTVIDTTGTITAGSGVFLGGTAALNLLNDYEESGNWTPTIIGSSVAGTQTYSVQTGKYTKIGDIVTCFFRVTMTAKDGATLGNFQISGLPFTSKNDANYGAMYFYLVGNVDFTASYTQISGGVEPNAAVAGMTQIGDNQTVNNLPVAAIQSNTNIQAVVTYRAT